MTSPWNHKHRDGTVHDHGELRTTGAHWHPPAIREGHTLSIGLPAKPDSIAVLSGINAMGTTWDDYQVEMVPA